MDYIVMHCVGLMLTTARFGSKIAT